MTDIERGRHYMEQYEAFGVAKCRSNLRRKIKAELEDIGTAIEMQNLNLVKEIYEELLIKLEKEGVWEKKE